MDLDSEILTLQQGAIRIASPLVWTLCPFFDVDVDAGLLFKPIIVRPPPSARIREADVKVPDNLRDQLVNFAQRDLRKAVSIYI